MSSIISFYLPQLHNGENVSFHNDSLEQLERHDPVQLGVVEEVNEYRGAVNELKTTIDVFSASVLSPESTRRDKHRDHSYSALYAFVKVCLNEEDEEKVDAAERIISVMRKSRQELGDPLHLGLAKESTAIASLLRNLEPLADDIRTIGATARLNKLAEANQAYIDLQFERYIEQGNKHSGDVKAARAVADAIYKKITDRINARILLEGGEAFTPYTNAQNAVVAKYKRIVTQRRGRPKKDSENETK
ncbi:MAG: DUF6261 family protein [Tannerella sp.]|jgi:hypothetical protein|nr:DUF6261 family protein [Tannerella sp.]